MRIWSLSSLYTPSANFYTVHLGSLKHRNNVPQSFDFNPSLKVRSKMVEESTIHTHIYNILYVYMHVIYTCMYVCMLTYA